MEERPRVIHLSADFPDPIEPRKTRAIERLLDLTDARFDHRVVSLNRRSPSLGRLLRGGSALEVAGQPFERGIAAVYHAPGRGLMHRTMLERLGDWLANHIAHLNGPPPALIVGHKLTVEGVAVAHAARRLGLPYALSIQGNTDEKILRLRPDLTPLFRQVLLGAQAVFPFTPWALDAVTHRLGASRRAPRLLPCATELDRILEPRPAGGGFVTAFHLRHWRVKNFAMLLRAHRRARAAGDAVPLALVGGGDDPAADMCRALAGREAGVRIEGEIPPERMPERLNAATALVLPSRRESFGLVFIEALFAGCPVIYPAGQAIDGYFPAAPFAIAVDARHPAAIARAMAHARRHETAIKAELAVWQRSADAERFMRPAIARQFADGLDSAIAAAD